jgi:hypothetical protein
MPASNTYDTSSPGSAALNREQLADYVTMLAPEKYPVTSLCSRGEANAVTFDWGVDALRAPRSSPVVEGSPQTSFTDQHANLARLSNTIQEFRDDARVTDWQEAMNKAGAKGIAAAETKCVKQVKRDIEFHLCGNSDKAVSAGDGTAGVTRAIGNWISSSGPSDVPSTYRTPAASIHSSGTLTETIFKGIITSIFRQDMMDASLTLVADTSLRALITGFTESTGSTNTTQRSFNHDADGRIRSTVSYYESDHGVVEVINMNPACAPDTTNKDTGYFIPNGMLVLREAIPLQSITMPEDAGGKSVVVKYVAGLELKHPGAFGKITTLS